jgi:hypothetical protein
MLCLGSPGKDQLGLLPGNVTGIPPGFQYHPFRFIDWKEEARIQKQAAHQFAKRTTEGKAAFLHGFWFYARLHIRFFSPQQENRPRCPLLR